MYTCIYIYICKHIYIYIWKFSCVIFPMWSCPECSRERLGPSSTPLNPHGSGPTVPTLDLMGRALMGHNWALMGWALLALGACGPGP